MPVGDPRELVDPSASAGQFELTLVKSESHFRNPQYMTLPRSQRDSGKVLRITNVCTHDGATVFDVDFTIYHP